MHIGLIGCGLWGQLILKTLTELAVTVTVCDTDPDIRRQALQLGALNATAFVDTLLSVDGLIIATPASTHCAVLEQIAPFGKPIYVEKPLAISYQEALRIGRLPLPPTFMMHIWRYHPGIELLQKISQSGELGELVLLKTTRYNWTSPRTDTDTLRTLTPHDLSILLHILGQVPTPKAALAERHNGQIRGLTVLMGDKPGCIIDVSTRYSDKRREVRLHGTAGVAVLADERASAVDIWYGTDQTSISQRQHERRLFDSTTPLQLELSAFIGYLQGGPPPISPLKEGIELMRILEEIERLT
ncbi:hypothetical protein GCM10028808_74530 [Spirosoma migulaei]